MKIKKTNPGNEKILLGLMPFWAPVIPALGLSHLKGFLQANGCQVKTLDANTEVELKEMYETYFRALRQSMPIDHNDNYFYNIGHDVMQNHMMAHLNRTEAGKDKYNGLLAGIIFQSFFCRVDAGRITALDNIVAEYYRRLRTYFLGVLARENPTVVGLSVYSHTLPSSVFIFRLIKERYPQIRTVMGGGIFANQLARGSPNFEFFLEKVPEIDHLFIGEGETLFLDYLRGELPLSQRVYTREDAGGRVMDMACTSVPDFSDYNPGNYPHLPFHMSRGCPFQCRFCSQIVLWGKYREKAIDRGVSELRELYEKYECRLFWFCDSLVNPFISRLAGEISRAGLPIYWDGYLRADRHVCSTDNTLAWRRGGFYRARLGLESGSQRLLDAMDKRIDTGQIKTATASLAYAGIKTSTYWIIGYPGETEEDFLLTLDIIKELKNDIYEAMCNPFNFYLSGQVNSEEWTGKNKSILLYPGDAADLLITQTWIMDRPPSREEIFRRVLRFTDHCRRLGIPNPYSLRDIHRADERWKKLHQNAVPSLLDLKDGGPDNNDEKNHRVKKLVPAEKEFQDDGDFDF